MFPRSTSSLDVRVYAPTSDVVIVRASGLVDTSGAEVLAAYVGHQVARAPDVVVDLCGVTALHPGGVDALRRARKEAADDGVTVHLAADAGAVRSALVAAALDDPALHHSAAEVIAGLRRG